MTQWARVRRELRPFITPAVLVIIYVIVRLIFRSTVGEHGVLAPSGSVDSVHAVLALATLGMRICVLVVVPFLVAYRLVIRLFGRTSSES